MNVNWFVKSRRLFAHLMNKRPYPLKQEITHNYCGYSNKGRYNFGDAGHILYFKRFLFVLQHN